MISIHLRISLAFIVCSSMLTFSVSADAFGNKVFSQPVGDLHADVRLDFMLGRSLFRRLWVSAPASTQAADGLGPLYNARSCAACHPNNGRGLPAREGGEHSESLLLRLGRSNLAGKIVSDPIYGRQLQSLAVAGQAAEGWLNIDYLEQPVTLSDGLVVSLCKPTYRVDRLGYGALHPQTQISARIAPQLIGLGLLDAIEEGDILARQDPSDLDGDGISGRANWVLNRATGVVAIGRFGHKASQPTIDQQSQVAMNTDLGISVPLYPDAAGDCTAQQVDCRQAPNGNSQQYDDLEAHQQVTDLLALYVSHLAVPARRNAQSSDVQSGRKVFERIGCQQCHTPGYRTGSQTEFSANRDQDIAPYTDLLLHDMGQGLADNLNEGLAEGREWRTAPLWGIGLTATVSGGQAYLHDGRARSLLEAILWHGGEAQAHRDNVAALDTRSREQLLAFLKSL